MSLWILNILIFTMGSFIFSQHFHFFGLKIQHFSTFGSNQDDHDIELLTCSDLTCPDLTCSDLGDPARSPKETYRRPNLKDLLGFKR